jgi:hypothetical protein
VQRNTTKPFSTTGVEEKTLDLLRKGEYGEVFSKPKYIENITADKSGIPNFIDLVSVQFINPHAVLLLI